MDQDRAGDEIHPVLQEVGRGDSETIVDGVR